MTDIVEQLRQRACQPGEPWTGDNPKLDHGHTDCWLHHQSIDEIERLRALITAWADASDADNKMWQSDPSISDRAVTFAAMRNAALELRQAVGR